MHGFPQSVFFFGGVVLLADAILKESAYSLRARATREDGRGRGLRPQPLCRTHPCEQLNTFLDLMYPASVTQRLTHAASCDTPAASGIVGAGEGGRAMRHGQGRWGSRPHIVGQPPVVGCGTAAFRAAYGAVSARDLIVSKKQVRGPASFMVAVPQPSWDGAPLWTPPPRPVQCQHGRGQ